MLVINSAKPSFTDLVSILSRMYRSKGYSTCLNRYEEGYSEGPIGDMYDLNKALRSAGILESKEGIYVNRSNGNISVYKTSAEPKWAYENFNGFIKHLNSGGLEGIKAHINSRYGISLSLLDKMDLSNAIRSAFLVNMENAPISTAIVKSVATFVEAENSFNCGASIFGSCGIISVWSKNVALQVLGAIYLAMRANRTRIAMFSDQDNGFINDMFDMVSSTPYDTVSSILGGHSYDITHGPSTTNFNSGNDINSITLTLHGDE